MDAGRTDRRTQTIDQSAVEIRKFRLPRDVWRSHARTPKTAE